MKNILLRSAKKVILIFISLILITINYNIFAADGDLDVTFNPSGAGPTQPGTVFTNVGLSNSFIFSIDLQSDGKLVVGGSADTGSGTQFALARYNADGSLDSSFGSGGIVSTVIPGATTSQINSIAIQSDGKIVAGGFSDAGIGLARYNANGTLDSSFGSGGISTDSVTVNSIAIQSDGKILTGRSSSVYRFNIDGTIDSSFGSGGFIDIPDFSSINSIAIQGDGKIVVGGTKFNSMTFEISFVVARSNLNGSIDNSFGINGVVNTTLPMSTNSAINSIAIQGDGKIVVGGYTSISGTLYFALARYSTVGLLDSSFGAGGIVSNLIGSDSSINSIALQNDGKIVAGGQVLFSSINFAIARYDTNGSLDNSFAELGYVATNIDSADSSIARSILIQPNGKIVVGGQADISGFNRFALARYLASSTLILSPLAQALIDKYCGS